LIHFYKRSAAAEEGRNQKPLEDNKLEFTMSTPPPSPRTSTPKLRSRLMMRLEDRLSENEKKQKKIGKKMEELVGDLVKVDEDLGKVEDKVGELDGNLKKVAKKVKQFDGEFDHLVGLVVKDSDQACNERRSIKRRLEVVETGLAQAAALHPNRRYPPVIPPTREEGGPDGKPWRITCRFECGIPDYWGATESSVRNTELNHGKRVHGLYEDKPKKVKK